MAAVVRIPGCLSRCCFQRDFSSNSAPSASSSGSFLLSTFIPSETRFPTPVLSTSGMGRFFVSLPVQPRAFFRPNAVPITPTIFPSPCQARPSSGEKSSSSFHGSHESFVFHKKDKIPKDDVGLLSLEPSTSNFRPHLVSNGAILRERHDNVVFKMFIISLVASVSQCD